MKGLGRPYEELHDLLARHLDGQLDNRQRARLQQWLRDDSEAQEIYLDYIAIDTHYLTQGTPSLGVSGDDWFEGDLPWTAEGEVLNSSAGEEYPIADSSPCGERPYFATEADNPETAGGGPWSPAGFLAPCASPAVQPFSLMGVFPWVAGVVFFACLAVGLSRWEGRSQPYPVGMPSTPPSPVAWISAVHEVEWANGQEPYGWGWALMAGTPVRLQSGLLRLVFSSGAEVLLQGPGSFTVETAESGRLGLGKLVARAETNQAQGFTIRTPTAQIVDLGTEFGVTVDEQGQTETHVFAGRVIAQAIGAKRAKSEPLRLKAGQAARVEPRTVRLHRVVPSPEAFTRHTPPRQVAPVLHYTMEEPSAPLADRRGNHKAKENGGRGFLYQQPGVPAGTYGAITLGPAGSGASAGLSDAASQWILDAAGTARLNLANNFTVMTWLYLPATPSGVVKVIGQSDAKPAAGWAFGVREAGAGRGILFSGNRIGDFYSGISIPWNGGQWHHIAVTKSSAEGIRFYLDGNLVGADSRPTARDNFRRLASNETYCLGRGNDYVKEPGNGRRIDDVRVYDTALTREEIILAASDAQ